MPLHRPSAAFDLDRVGEPFATLRSQRLNIVPVIGAGLSYPAGAPSGTDLIEAMKRAARDEGLAVPNGLGFFSTGNLLEAECGRAFLQEVVARRVADKALTPTPALLGVARTPSRLVVTTNYDLAIEKAVEAQGLNPVSLTVGDANRALGPRPGGSVHVLHLHGVVDRPDTIVLSKSSYEEALRDDVAEHALRQLASQSLLVFLGQSLSNEEEDIYAGLEWVTEKFNLDRPHLLLERGDAGVPTVTDKVLDAFSLKRVRVPDPKGRYEFTEVAAAILGGAPRTASDPVTVSAFVDEPYVALPVGLESEALTGIGRGGLQYQRYIGEELTVHKLDDEMRLVLVGEPGTGKSHTLLNLAKESADHALWIPLRGACGPPPGGDAISALLNWAHNAKAAHEGTPQLRDSVQKEPWLICLDGLDEVRWLTALA